jgi:hypothetical protein
VCRPAGPGRVLAAGFQEPHGTRLDDVTADGRAPWIDCLLQELGRRKLQSTARLLGAQAHSLPRPLGLGLTVKPRQSDGLG